MNNLNIMNVKMKQHTLFTALLISILWWGALNHVSAAEKEGTDTGHGTDPVMAGESVVYPRKKESEWIQNIPGWIEDALTRARSPEYRASDSRKELMRSLEGMLGAYAELEPKAYPFSFGVLQMAGQASKVLPGRFQTASGTTGTEASIGDDAAYVFLWHFFEAAKQTGLSFDQKSKALEKPELRAAYVSEYLNAVRQIVRVLFASAHVNQPNRGSVVDALGQDRNELMIVYRVLLWMSAELSRPSIKSAFGCYQVRAEQIARSLNEYLGKESDLSKHYLKRIQIRKHLENLIQGFEKAVFDKDSNSVTCHLGS